MTDTERIAELLQQQNELLEQRLESGNGNGKRRRRAEEDDDSPRSVREMGGRKESGGAGVWIPVQLSFRSGKTVRLYVSADFDGDEEDLYQMVEDMKRRVEVNFYQPKRFDRYEGNGYRGGYRNFNRGGYGGGYRD